MIIKVNNCFCLILLLNGQLRTSLLKQTEITISNKEIKCFAEPSPYCKKQGKRKRIRKSTSRLSEYEKSKLRQALKLAIANQTKWMNFPDVANFHGAPYDVCPDQGSKGCCPHIGDSKNIHAVMDFLPWHRLYLGMIVTMNKINKWHFNSTLKGAVCSPLKQFCSS